VDNVQTAEISGESMACKILMFQNYEENNPVLLNDSPEKLIQPFRRQIGYLQELCVNRIE
jgi:hypothetical protein